jgi:metal-responsive CopG/Arc/MetJ family transcriptional regulator
MKSRKIVVFLSDDLASWLDAKASEGYKRSTLIRHVLFEYKKSEAQKQA